MKIIIYSLLTFLTINTLSYASDECQPSPPKRRLIHVEPEEPEEREEQVETKQDFINNFYQGQRVLNRENLERVGIQIDDQELTQKMYKDDITLYFFLNLCKEKLIDAENFMCAHRQAVINANVRANNGIAAASYNIGFIYCFGVCQPQSNTFGEEYMTKAAEQGSFQAMLFLSEFYKNGQIFEANSKKAEYWGLKSLERLMEGFEEDALK